MKSKEIIITVMILATSYMIGMTLSDAEKELLEKNREEFLNALKAQPSLVFEPTTEQQFDLRGVDLHELNFMNAIITNVDLSGANLSGTNIMAAKLTNINLSGANLSKAKANNTKFRQCTLDGADFSDAEMPGVQILGEPDRFVTAQNLNAQGANISNGALLQYVDLSGANMSGCNFHGSILENIIVNDKTSFSYDKPVVEDERTSLSSAQLYYWTGYSGDLLSWLLKQVPNERLMANISIDGANAGIPQN